VDPGIQAITLAKLSIAGAFFDTNDGVETVIGVISFPLIASPPLGSTIEVNFNSDNIINRTSREALDAVTTDGYVLVFSPLDCTSATVADNLGSASGTAINIDYLDANAMGNGGDITLTMNHPTTNPTSIVITPDDGSGAITLIGGQIGSGSTTLALTTAADGTPANSVDSVSYSIVYGVDNPLGGTSLGEPCTVTVTWNQPSCTIASDPVSPQLGDSVDFDVTLTNALWNGTSYGTITLPGASTVDLVTPSSVAGNVLTFSPGHNIPTIALSDAGTYTTSVAGPGVGNTSTCTEDVFFVCPTNNTVCPAGLVTIGGTVDITLSGVAVADWDVTYNGVTTNYPATTTTVTVTGLVGDQTDVTITANGADQAGPCSDVITCTLEFVDPTCGPITQDPDSTTTPVDVGTVITLSLVSSGAVSATIDGVGMTPSSDPNSNPSTTWTASHTAVADDVVTVVITNPNGDTASCSWVIDINCIEPVIELPLPPIGSTGITVSGTPGCTYTVFITGPDGVEQTVDITVGDGGLGTDSTVTVTADTNFCVAQLGQPNPGCTITTVPTLGEWGLIAFVMMLMTSAIFLTRRKQIV
jgi:hypothetical protein